MLSNLLVQLVNGLADASTLFLVAVGSVADLRRDAHRQFRARLVLYARHLCRVQHREPLRRRRRAGFWLSVLAAALVVAVLGALVEVIVLRRIYQAPELFHLLATFALVLIFRDAAL